MKVFQHLFVRDGLCIIFGAYHSKSMSFLRAESGLKTRSFSVVLSGDEGLPPSNCWSSFPNAVEWWNTSWHTLEFCSHQVIRPCSSAGNGKYSRVPHLRGLDLIKIMLFVSVLVGLVQNYTNQKCPIMQDSKAEKLCLC